MIDRTIDSLSPLVYMVLGIVLAALSMAVGDQATAGALLAAACCSMALTGVRWAQREAAVVHDR